MEGMTRVCSARGTVFEGMWDREISVVAGNKPAQYRVFYRVFYKVEVFAIILWKLTVRLEWTLFTPIRKANTYGRRIYSFSFDSS
jgi:hypothetical protein